MLYLAWVGLVFDTESPGTKAEMSPMSSAASDSSVLAVTTLTVIGTSCRLCSRRCAVTTTSSRVVASCAVARPGAAMAASATLPASVALRQCSILIIAAPPKAPFLKLQETEYYSV
ncbi:hypothetical protein V8F63_14730 [Brevundimonas sp. LF-1]|uniref:hypothetical protein n=1 Tax=Brevundimonas sp. LF-1 TaxID=3126100 RepID=UPI0030DFA7F9